MADALIVPGPQWPPGACFFCGSPEGPCVDTTLDIVGDGRVYVCVRTCLPLWARLAGYATPGQTGALTEALAGLRARVDQLEAELADEREHKLVSVSDMLGLVERIRGGPPAEPLEVELRLCGATRGDGKPCRAVALEGLDVCHAHSKQRSAL